MHCLIVVKPKRVWMPKYTCDVMYYPLFTLGIEIEFYDLAEPFNVAESVTLGSNDWLLYVNYFGICNCTNNIAIVRNSYA